MRITRVHVGDVLALDTEIRFDKSASHYLKHVLRLKSGAAVSLFNGEDATDYRASVIIDGKQVRARIEAAVPVDTESALDSEIIQGLGRADHMDWMVQKTTELGIDKIALFNAEHTQSPLKPAQRERKLAHWHAVSVSACEQCGRARLPAIEFHPDLGQALAASAHGFSLVLDPGGAPLVSLLKAPQAKVSILLGPEGGLNQYEIGAARDIGFRTASLGPRVLRTETAAAAALAIVQSTLGDLR